METIEKDKAKISDENSLMKCLKEKKSHYENLLDTNLIDLNKSSLLQSRSYQYFIENLKLIRSLPASATTDATTHSGPFNSMRIQLNLTDCLYDQTNPLQEQEVCTRIVMHFSTSLFTKVSYSMLMNY